MDRVIIIKDGGSKDWFWVKSGGINREILGIDNVHKIIDEVFNPQAKPYLNLPLSRLVPDGVGEIVSKWEE